MTNNQRLLFWSLLLMGGLFILVPQLYYWSQAQTFQYSVFKVVAPEMQQQLMRLRLSLLPWKYIGILQVGVALGLFLFPRLKEED